MPTLIFLPPGYTISKAAKKIQQDLATKNIGANLSYEQLEECLSNFRGDLLASSIFLEKYALKDQEGHLHEYLFSQAKVRWAKAIAQISRDKFHDKKRYTDFVNLYEYFLPAGRQMAGLGNKFVNNLSFSNCYATAVGEDSLEGIFKTAYDIAKTFAFSGGQGVDISPLRPNQSPTSNAAGSSTGSVSFGELYSYVTGTIGQRGRRGALILLMRVDHPDIEEFITAKVGSTDRIRYANISVKITDKFMKAVELDTEIELYFTTPHKTHTKFVSARHIWNLISRSAAASGEPGIIFWDTVKKYSPSEIYPELQLVATNPCGELPLSSGDACVLGSMLLPEFVENPYTNEASFNFDLFEEMISKAVTHLDNVVELNIDKHPLQEQQQKAAQGRRIGLGVVGLADMLARLGFVYGSEKANEFCAHLFYKKMVSEYNASIKLAQCRRPFLLCNLQKHYEQRFCRQRLPGELLKEGKEWGQRNVTISAIAPTSSLAIMAQYSHAIEPCYERKFDRIVELGGGRRSYTVHHHEISRAAEIIGKDISEVPVELFPSAYEVDPMDRVKLQSIVQQYTDSAISSTINLPEGTSYETVNQIYLEAWKKELKGITVYVEGSREGILLRKKEQKKNTQPRARYLDTKTHRFIAEAGDKFYVHVSYKDGDLTKPYQVFITNYRAQENDRFVKLANDLRRTMEESSKVDQNKLTEQLDRSPNSLVKITRLVSLALKSGELELILQVMNPHAFVGTLAARLSTILEPSLGKTNMCPQCQVSRLQQQEGCATCPSCGYSACNG